MTNREYIQSLSYEEVAKYLNIYSHEEGFVFHSHICDYKHEGKSVARK